MIPPVYPTDLLERLNDPGEQEMGYPCIDDLEEHIDLTATDILHGWRDSSASGSGAPETQLFSDAFANVFRVLVFHTDQQVFRRSGVEEGRWVWRQTGRIVGWTVSSLPEAGFSGSADDLLKERSFYGTGRERWFATAADAADRARELVAVAGEQVHKARVLVRGIELADRVETYQPQAFEGLMLRGSSSAEVNR